MRQQKSELHSRECFPEQKYDRKSLGMETRGWKCDEGQPYLSFDLCDRHRTYLCRPSANKPKSRPARSSVTAVVCLTDQPHSARNRNRKADAGSITAQPYAAVAESPQGVEHLGPAEFARSRRSECVPGAASRYKLSATGQEQCAGEASLAVRAVDGISLLQGIEVSAPSPSLPGGFEPRTVVAHGHAHVVGARGPHNCGRACSLRCAGWVDSRGVRSAQKSDFFLPLRSRPPRRHQAKRY